MPGLTVEEPRLEETIIGTHTLYPINIHACMKHVMSI